MVSGKSSQSMRIHSAALRDKRGPQEIRFLGYGEKSVYGCLMLAKYKKVGQ